MTLLRNLPTCFFAALTWAAIAGNACPAFAGSAKLAQIVCEGLFISTTANVSPSSLPLQPGLRMKAARRMREAELNSFFEGESFRNSGELYPRGMVDRHATITLVEHEPEGGFGNVVSGLRVRGREIFVERPISETSAVKIPGPVADLFLVRSLSHRRSESGVTQGDLVRVFVNRFNRMTFDPLEQIELEIEVSLSERDLRGNHVNPPRAFVDSVNLPLSVPLDSVVRRILIPLARDEHGVFKVYVQTSNDLVSVFEFNRRDLRTWEQQDERKPNARPIPGIRLKETITVEEFEGS